MARVLGVDPGLTRCGIAVVEVDARRRARLVHVEVAGTAADTALHERLLHLDRVIERVLERFVPDAAAVERMFANANTPTVLGTAQAAGVAITAAARAGLEVGLHTPSEAKAAVTGSGTASKAQVTAMVTRILGLDAAPRPADAADAIALALTHAWRAGSLGSAAGQTGLRTESMTSRATGSRFPAQPGPARASGAETQAQRRWLEAEAAARRPRRGGVR